MANPPPRETKTLSVGRQLPEADILEPHGHGRRAARAGRKAGQVVGMRQGRADFARDPAARLENSANVTPLFNNRATQGNSPTQWMQEGDGAFLTVLHGFF